MSKPKFTPPRRKPLPPRKERCKVLIVMHGTGLIEVHAEDHIDVCVVNRLYVPNEDAELANTIDDYTMGMVPRCYRELYFPNKCRATGFHEKVTPEMAKAANSQLSVVRGLRKMREETKKR